MGIFVCFVTVKKGRKIDTEKMKLIKVLICFVALVALTYSDEDNSTGEPSGEPTPVSTDDDGSSTESPGGDDSSGDGKSTTTEDAAEQTPPSVLFVCSLPIVGNRLF